MTDLISVAKQNLLAPANLNITDVENLFNVVMRSGVDDADIYFQQSKQESWLLEDGIIKDASFDIDQGVGVRAMSGEKTGFAYSDEIILPALERAATTVASISRQGQSQRLQAWRSQQQVALYEPLNTIDSLSAEEKILLLNDLNQIARQQDSRITQVTVSLSGVYDTILVMRADGHMAADIRPLMRVDVSVVIEENGRREKASCGGGGRTAYFKPQTDAVREFAIEAVRQAQVKLNAIAAPAGTMPVVLGPGWPGVLLHEAVGHGLEADFNRKGSSAYSGKIGERVASSLCTIVDDGTIKNRRGSLSVDDEGNPTQKTVLIENGVLKTYMQDNLNARLMGMQPTGNGRRESYADLPLPRMTNTYMLPGKDNPQDIIASVDKGIYAVNFDGGQVDITSGKFVFSASEAYLIEKGKITQPVKGATLIGNGPQAMQFVSMVGNDLKLDRGVGVCGKDGQSVPVGVGQPTLKIDKMTVGGTAQS